MVTLQEIAESYADLLHKYTKLAIDYQILFETLTELSTYNKGLADELRYKNPDISLRMMNKIGDILTRNTESLRNNK